MPPGTVKIFITVLVFAEAIFLIKSFVLNKQMAAVECKAKFRVPSYDIENLKNRKMPQSKEGKCMMACILKKLNVINKEGKFEVRTVKNWIQDKYKGNKAEMSKAYARADNCAQQLPTAGKDECEYAAKILECSKKQKKIGN